MKDFKVPFYANRPEGTYCFQAVLKMVLKYFLPKKNFSWKKLEKITAKEKDMWTWQMAGLIWLKENGFSVKVMEVFDYNAFAKDGKRYLEKDFGKKVADEQDEHSVLKKEIPRAKDFVENIKPIFRIPELSDIKHFLNDGYLIVTVVNSRTLNNVKGYCGHFVLIKGFEEKTLILHDPGGYPGKANRKISFDLFEKAWAYPNQKAKNIIAIKL